MRNLMSVNGFGVFWAALNSLLCIRASEIIGVNLAAAVSPVTAFVIALMIGETYLFTVCQCWENQNVSKKLKPYLIFALTDDFNRV